MRLQSNSAEKINVGGKEVSTASLVVKLFAYFISIVIPALNYAL